MSRRIGSEPGQIGWWTWSTTFRVGSDRFGAPSDRRSVRSDTGCRSGCRYKLSGRRNRERGRRDRERGRRDNVSGRRDRERIKNDSEAEQSAPEPKRMPSVCRFTPCGGGICPPKVQCVVYVVGMCTSNDETRSSETSSWVASEINSKTASENVPDRPSASDLHHLMRIKTDVCACGGLPLHMK